MNFYKILKLNKINYCCGRNLVVMTGIQPTGSVHIGNFLGPIRECRKLSERNDISKIYLSIVDLHSLTHQVSSETIYEDIHSILATLLAVGLNTNKVVIFQQSKVLYHANLSWVLMCLLSKSRLEHMPQWNEKSKSVGNGNCGLLTYPVLQAADILLYRPNLVPVGEDQSVHLDMARLLRRRLLSLRLPNDSLNKHLERFIPIPNMMEVTLPKVYSLRKELTKMSKSDPDSHSRICLTDSDDLIYLKIQRALTDSIKEVAYDPEGRPALANLIRIYAAVLDKDIPNVLEEEGICKMQKTELKRRLAEILVETIRPIRKRINELLQEPDHLERILNEGSRKADDCASLTMNTVWKYIGLRSVKPLECQNAGGQVCPT